MRILKWSAALVAALMAILVIVALRPPQHAPASGLFGSCGTPWTPVGYGLLGIGAASEPVIDQVAVDGHTFDLRKNRDGRLFLWGGCNMRPAETGAVCLTCRRTWILEWEGVSIPLRQEGWWWRLKGGLLRLL